jgi:hypothetical protein
MPLQDPVFICRPLVKVWPEQKLMKFAVSLRNLVTVQEWIEYSHVAEADCPSFGVAFPSSADPVCTALEFRHAVPAAPLPAAALLLLLFLLLPVAGLAADDAAAGAAIADVATVAAVVEVLAIPAPLLAFATPLLARFRPPPDPPCPNF